MRLCSILGISMAMPHLLHKHQKSCTQVQKLHTLCCCSGFKMIAARKCPPNKACLKDGFHHSHFFTLCCQCDVVTLRSMSKTNYTSQETCTGAVAKTHDFVTCSRWTCTHMDTQLISGTSQWTAQASLSPGLKPAVTIRTACVPPLGPPSADVHSECAASRRRASWTA